MKTNARQIARCGSGLWCFGKSYGRKQRDPGRLRYVLRYVRYGLICAFALAGCLNLAPDFRAQQRRTAEPIPLGLPADTWDYYVPRNNRPTPAKIELGRKLFFDARLSADGHKPELAFTDGKAVAEGVGGRLGPRNSPTLLNSLFYPNPFWDGRADSLEDQAIQPLTNPLEMGNASYDAVVARLRALPDYHEAFRQAFNQPITIDRIGQAISAYERTLVSGDSPFDRFIAGDSQAIGEAAKRGFALFRGKGRCSRCHTFNDALPLFSDFNYHNTGVAMNHPRFEQLARRVFDAAETDRARDVIDRAATENGGSELGRILVSYQILDLGSFRTPSLRNIARTAPYFHDGSARTLADVIRFYNQGGLQNLNREWDLNALALTDDEQRDLVNFLESLTSPMPDVESKPTSRAGGNHQFHEQR
jgi:cytochrome c peroxidase